MKKYNSYSINKNATAIHDSLRNISIDDSALKNAILDSLRIDSIAKLKGINDNNIPEIKDTKELSKITADVWSYNQNKSDTSNYETLINNSENDLIELINNSTIKQFKQSKYLQVTLELEELKKLYIVTIKNKQKNNLALKFRNLSNDLQNGYIYPACRNTKGIIDLNCIDFDQYFFFNPEYKLAKTCAEASYNLGGKCDVYGDLYRYGRGVKKDYLKAYDIYKISGKRGDEYYEISINEMTQDILISFGKDLKKDGSLGVKTNQAIKEIVPDIGTIGRILNRIQFESLINKIGS